MPSLGLALKRQHSPVRSTLDSSVLSHNLACVRLYAKHTEAVRGGSVALLHDRSYVRLTIRTTQEDMVAIEGNLS